MISRKFTSISISLLLISLLLVSQTTCAQKKNIVKEKAEVDTTALFNGLSVGVDLFGAVQRQVSDYGQYEAYLKVNLKDRYFPVFELGLGDAKHDDDAITNISVKTRAPYARIGCDFNLSKNKHDIYRMFGGVRYALTSFDFEVSHPGVTDPVWGGTAEYAAKEKCTFHWMELVFGVDAKVVGPVHLGWSVRYRHKIHSTKCDIGDPWYVPGYGRSGNSRIGGEFNLSLEI